MKLCFKKLVTFSFLWWSEVIVAQSCPTLCNPMDSPWNSPGQNTGVGSFSLLQGIFPTQGWNPGVLHCRWTLYQLSHKGGPFYGKVKVKVVQSYSTLCDQRSLALQADSLPAEPQGKPFCHKGGVICISEFIDISPGSLGSSLCFMQPGISHDVLCI